MLNSKSQETFLSADKMTAVISITKKANRAVNASQNEEYFPFKDILVKHICMKNFKWVTGTFADIDLATYLDSISVRFFLSFLYDSYVENIFT